jgi:hypothetical protein
MIDGGEDPIGMEDMSRLAIRVDGHNIEDGEISESLGEAQVVAQGEVVVLFILGDELLE